MSLGSGVARFNRAIAAPAATGTRKVTRYVGFAPAPTINGSAGLRVSFCMPYLDVAMGASSSSPAAILRNVGSSYSSVVNFDPSVTGVWLAKAIPQLTGLFSRFFVRKLGLRYAPSGGITSERAPFAIGWVADPAHPVTSSPTVAKIENLQSQVLFNGWEEWDLECAVDDSLESYSYNTSETTGAGTRLMYPGAIIGVGDFSSTPAVKYGTIYAECVMDLYDFSSIYSSLSEEVDRLKAEIARLRGEPVSSYVVEQYDNCSEPCEQKSMPAGPPFLRRAQVLTGPASRPLN